MRVRNLLRLKEYGDFLVDYGAVLERQVEERTADLQRFRLAMDATADAIFLTSRATMKFVEVNATASAMLGYTREELLTLGPRDLRAAVPADAGNRLRRPRRPETRSIRCTRRRSGARTAATSRSSCTGMPVSPVTT